MKKVSKKVLAEGIKRINAQIAEMSDLNQKLSKQLDKVEKDTRELKKAFRSLDKELVSDDVVKGGINLVNGDVESVIPDPFEAFGKEIIEGFINHVEGEKDVDRVGKEIVEGKGRSYNYKDKLSRVYSVNRVDKDIITMKSIFGSKEMHVKSEDFSKYFEIMG